MINCLGDGNSIASQYLSELRDTGIQQDRMRFRKNVERLGEIFGWEISKKLEYVEKEIQTPLGTAKHLVLKNQPVLATILRAGLPFHQGLLNVFDRADNAFISAFRKYDTESAFHIELDYVATPDLAGKILLLADPMLATGWSLGKVYTELMKYGKPAHTHIVSIIAAKPGIDYLQKFLPANSFTIWTVGIDEKLNKHSYIVPGLGDAGDLAYGEKK
jgi:uracil phosphoribosyltransferase